MVFRSRLRRLACFQPVVVNESHPRIAVGDRVQFLHPFQQIRQLGLPIRREQEIVERLEALSLIRFGDAASIAEHLVQQLPLRSVPRGHSSPHVPVQCPEVCLDLAKIRQQLACHARELLVAIPLRRRIQHGELASFHPGDLRVDLSLAPAQLREPGFRIGLRTEHHLPQQLKDRVQPRLGANKRPLAQRLHPVQRLLHRRGRVEMRRVSSGWIVFSQPTALRRRPLVQVRFRRTWKCALPNRSFSAYSSSSNRLTSSSAGIERTLSATNTRPRKPSTNGA